MKTQVLATVAETDEFLKALAFVAFAIKNEELDKQSDLASIKKIVNGWRNNSDPVLAQFGIPSDLFIATVNTARDGDAGFANKAKAFRRVIKANTKQMMKDSRNVSHTQKGILTSLLTYFNTGSDPSWKALGSRVAELNSPVLRRLYAESVESKAVPETGKQKEILDTLKKIRKIAPTSSHTQFLTPSELKVLGEKNPKAKADYDAAYKELKSIFMAALHAIVTSGKARYMPIPDVLAKLKKAGVNFSLFAKNADYPGLYVNEKGVIGVTPEGDVTANVSIINPIQTITLNPKFDFNNPTSANNKYVYMSQRTDQNLTPSFQSRVYSKPSNNSNAQKRQATVKGLKANLKDYINKWRADLDKGSLNGIRATIAEAAYLTAARIQGSGGMSKGEPTFGVLSWNISHVVHIDQKKHSIEFKFSAKSGKTQHIKLNAATIEPKSKAALIQMIKNVGVLMRGKKPTDKLFTFKGRALSNHDYVLYLKHHIGYKGGAHKFRHVRGTELFNDLIAKAPFKKGQKVTDKDAIAFFKECATKVGETLGHQKGDDDPTSTTAIKYYIDPEPMAAYFDALNVRMPKIVEERIAKLGLDSQREEENDADGEDVDPAEAPPIKNKEPASKGNKGSKNAKPVAGKSKVKPDKDLEEFMPDEDGLTDDLMPGEDDEYHEPKSTSKTIKDKIPAKKAVVQIKTAGAKKIAVTEPIKTKNNKAAPVEAPHDRLIEEINRLRELHKITVDKKKKAVIIKRIIEINNLLMKEADDVEPVNAGKVIKKTATAKPAKEEEAETDEEEADEIDDPDPTPVATGKAGKVRRKSVFS